MERAEIAARKAEILAECRKITYGRIAPADYLEACLFGYDILEWDKLVKLSREFKELHETERALVTA